MKKDLLSINDLNKDEILELIALAQDLKKDPWRETLKHKTMALIFEKPSLRTRTSFEIGMHQLGGEAIYLSPAEIGLGKREPVKDVTRVIERFADVIVARVFAHETLTEMSKYTNKHVVNALCNKEHPCQILADLLTILECKGTLQGLKIAYIGDSNNITNSMVLAASKLGLHIAVASPKGHTLDENILRAAQENAFHTFAVIEQTSDPKVAVKDADVIYTDTWISMGEEAEREERLIAFKDYQVNMELLSHAKSDVIFMHCLPAHRGEEVTDEVMESKHSVIFQEAENRLHAQKAVLVKLFEEK
ncbi:MAG: ornithine carbamoyltransferase [Dehalococcoidales bacterium]|jgi:ornithine carbamoyltransferase|nr:ornithine carbamoyltransferase [Dehalococcoidales bacterium]